MTTAAIVSLVLALLGIAVLFVPRVPAVLLSYASLVAAHIGGAFYVSSKVLVFWGVATAIVLGIRMIQHDGEKRYAGLAYVSGGAIVGVILGYLVAAMVAGFIIGGAIGAFFGAIAYMRLYDSPRYPVGSRQFVDFLCARGLPAVIATTMSAISLACIL